jgi:hypothetical protein
VIDVMRSVRRSKTVALNLRMSLDATMPHGDGELFMSRAHAECLLGAGDTSHASHNNARHATHVAMLTLMKQMQ